MHIIARRYGECPPEEGKGGWSMGIGIGEVIIIVAAIVLVFGATQIPKIARSLGEGLKEFKKSVKESKELDKENEDKIEKKD